MSTTPYCRPDPEQLLRLVEQQEAAEHRGRLKLFLGYAPRVGKSMRMFDEGRRRLERGQDVIIGCIQQRGVEHLAALLPLFEIIPLCSNNSMDVDAILRRKPGVCLVDELAAGNRWQDVARLLENGINVVTAINLQFIAELQDAVERITGKRAPDAVPQAFIQSADEIVIVDVPPEDLGKTATTVEQRHLSSLREMALLVAAEVVESQLQRYMEAHGIHRSLGTQERILVCITPRSEARSMLQTGRYAADRFHGRLLALYVNNRELTREAQELLDQNLELARQLGAEVHTLAGPDPIEQIIDFARQQRVTQIYIGHTQQASWRFWKANPVDRLIAAAEGIDVRIFPHHRAA